jgi:cytochrome P450
VDFPGIQSIENGSLGRDMWMISCCSQLPGGAGVAIVYNPYDWGTHEDPYPIYRALRDEAPVYFNAELDFWALSRHEDVLAAFRDSERFSNAEGIALEREQLPDVSVVMSFLGMDPPRHDRLRALVNRGFTPRRVAALEPHIRELAVHYLDSFVADGRCDFIGQFAGKLPMDVISEMVGVPPEDRDTLRAWADTVVHREEGKAEVPVAGMEAATKILRYFAKHVNERRSTPPNDLTGALITAEIDGERLSNKDLIAFLFLMIIAGNETTTKLLGNALYWLSKNPDQRAKVLADPGLIPGWVEETLRFDASSQLIARTTTCDIEIRGRTIPKGARVALLIGAANRDERVFRNPDVYDVTRQQNESLAFGYGTHFCLGASLARLEGRVALEEVLVRMPDYAIRAEGTKRIHSSNVRGFAALPIEFTAAGRA